MAFKTREDALASLKAVSYIDEFHDMERDIEGRALEDEDGDAIWIAKEIFPQVFLHPDNNTGLVVSAEDGESFGDYYGECRGEVPWVHPVIEAWADKHGYIVEWRDPGSLVLHPNT